MRASTRLLVIGFVVLFLGGCSTLFPEFVDYQPAEPPPPPPPRTIVIDGFEVTEGENAGPITCWKCNDRVNGGPTLVEFGYFETATGDQIGFVLFDGSDEGTEAVYSRDGLDHRWDWGYDGSGYQYAFAIAPDGYGYFYDFTTAKGDTATASNDYRCRRQ